jgi:hypothetical protein
MWCLCGSCIPRTARKEADDEKESLTEQGDAAEESAAKEERQAEVVKEDPSEPLREEGAYQGKLSLTAVIEGMEASAIESVKMRILWGEGDEREVSLQRTAKQWIGRIAGVVHGEAFEILAIAYDGEGKERARAEVRGMVLRADREGALWLSLRPPEEMPTVWNRAPRLLALWLDSTVGIAGETIFLRVFSRDDPQEEIRLRWESDTLAIEEDAADDHVFRLSIPAMPQSTLATLFLRLNDPRQGRRALRIRLPLTQTETPDHPLPAFHRAPTLHYVRAISQRLKRAGKTGFQLGYEAGDGKLSFSWSAKGEGCGGGLFEGEKSASPIWTAPPTAPEKTTCQIAIRLHDEEGNETEGEAEIALIEERWELLLAGTAASHPVKMAQAPDGDLVILGRFTETLEITSLRLVAGTLQEGYFVTRADQDGNIRWLLGLTGTGRRTIRALATAPDGDILLWGEYTQDLTIQGQTISATGLNDLFLARLRGDGSLRWLRSFGSPAPEEAGMMKIGAEGTIYVTGSFSNTMRFGDIEKKTTGLTDGFVGALDAEGRWLWVHTASSTLFTYLPDLFVTPQGEVWVAGLHLGDARLGDLTLAYQSSLYQGFVARLDAQKGWQEAEGFGEVGISEPLLHLTQAGEIILCGHFKDRLRFGAITLERINAEFHFFLAFRDATRQWRWAREIGLLPQATYQFPGKCTALYEENGEIYVLGVLASKTVNVLDSFTCDEQSCGASLWARLDHQGRWNEVECLLPSTETSPQRAAMILTQEAWFAVLSIGRPGFFCGSPPTLPLGVVLRKRPRRLFTTP